MSERKSEKKLQAAQRGWVELDDGYEMTQSGEIIGESLSRLKAEAIPIILVQEGYQSGHCLLLNIAGNRLRIDKPFDWPGAGKDVRVVFSGANKLWHHFYTKIFAEAGSILEGAAPTELYKLQRRNHFRVRVPIHSRASFLYEGVKYQDLTVHDLSAGGAKLSSSLKLQLPDQAQVSELNFEVYAGPDNLQRFEVHCRNGRIIRSIPDESGEGITLAVQFLTNTSEEDAILRYVRQRELDFLRRGLA